MSKEGHGLQKVSATAGTLEPAMVLAGGDLGHRAPAFLPDGVHFLYLAQVGGHTELRVGSVESKETVEPYDVTGDSQRFLVPTVRPLDDFRVVLNWPGLLPW